MQKRLISIAFIILCFGLLLIGCKEAEGTTPEATSSEMVSEVEAEEVSEPVSEETTGEVVSEEIPEETMDLTPYSISNGKFVIDLVADMEYDELKIIVWGEDSAKKILSDGDIYEIEKDDSLYIYYPQKMSSITTSMDYVEISTQNEEICIFNVYGTGENIEVTFKGTDVDGKEYEITFYIIKDWKYEWE